MKDNLPMEAMRAHITSCQKNGKEGPVAGYSKRTLKELDDVPMDDLIEDPFATDDPSGSEGDDGWIEDSDEEVPALRKLSDVNDDIDDGDDDSDFNYDETFLSTSNKCAHDTSVDKNIEYEVAKQPESTDFVKEGTIIDLLEQNHEHVRKELAKTQSSVSVLPKDETSKMQKSSERRRKQVLIPRDKMIKKTSVVHSDPTLHLQQNTPTSQSKAVASHEIQSSANKLKDLNKKTISGAGQKDGNALYFTLWHPKNSEVKTTSQLQNVNSGLEKSVPRATVTKQIESLKSDHVREHVRNLAANDGTNSSDKVHRGKQVLETIAEKESTSKPGSILPLPTAQETLGTILISRKVKKERCEVVTGKSAKSENGNKTQAPKQIIVESHEGHQSYPQVLPTSSVKDSTKDGKLLGGDKGSKKKYTSVEEYVEDLKRMMQEKGISNMVVHGPKRVISDVTKKLNAVTLPPTSVFCKAPFANKELLKLTTVNEEPLKLNSSVPTANKEPLKLNPSVRTANKEPLKLNPTVRTANEEPLKLNPSVRTANEEPLKLNPSVPTVNKEPLQLNPSLLPVNKEPLKPHVSLPTEPKFGESNKSKESSVKNERPVMTPSSVRMPALVVGASIKDSTPTGISKRVVESKDLPTTLSTHVIKEPNIIKKSDSLNVKGTAPNKMTSVSGTSNSTGPVQLLQPGNNLVRYIVTCPNGQRKILQVPGGIPGVSNKTGSGQPRILLCKSSVDLNVGSVMGPKGNAPASSSPVKVITKVFSSGAKVKKIRIVNKSLLSDLQRSHTVPNDNKTDPLKMTIKKNIYQKNIVSNQDGTYVFTQKAAKEHRQPEDHSTKVSKDQNKTVVKHDTECSASLDTTGDICRSSDNLGSNSTSRRKSRRDRKVSRPYSPPPQKKRKVTPSSSPSNPVNSPGDRGCPGLPSRPKPSPRPVVVLKKELDIPRDVTFSGDVMGDFPAKGIGIAIKSEPLSDDEAINALESSPSRIENRAVKTEPDYDSDSTDIPTDPEDIEEDDVHANTKPKEQLPETTSATDNCGLPKVSETEFLSRAEKMRLLQQRIEEQESILENIKKQRHELEMQRQNNPYLEDLM
ncbi:uncharacterized protein LOC121405791 [Lytechinus variegatus]|uniref:uncharacterized protein LOC121405791 n=1 Tax=Lytechinus variegatus TaxID=7654 RepID=UPI001BB250AF|nr:uncharacterized protein LOC121405791 [Lytechinus variegatus]XP_041452677.1 uncharacterized protein LOC121405791 [Lytechinus variegatus]